jgi:membrane protein
MRLKTFAKRLYEEYENDAVADSAAALSYYFVFALFPFLFFLATLTAFVPYIRRSVDLILARGHAILPEQAIRAGGDPPARGWSITPGRAC